jgi:hypothetical protein
LFSYLQASREANDKVTSNKPSKKIREKDRADDKVAVLERHLDTAAKRPVIRVASEEERSPTEHPNSKRAERAQDCIVHDNLDRHSYGTQREFSDRGDRMSVFNVYMMRCKAQEDSTGEQSEQRPEQKASVDEESQVDVPYSSSYADGREAEQPQANDTAGTGQMDVLLEQMQDGTDCALQTTAERLAVQQSDEYELNDDDHKHIEEPNLDPKEDKYCRENLGEDEIFSQASLATESEQQSGEKEPMCSPAQLQRRLQGELTFLEEAEGLEHELEQIEGRRQAESVLSDGGQQSARLERLHAQHGDRVHALASRLEGFVEEQQQIQQDENAMTSDAQSLPHSGALKTGDRSQKSHLITSEIADRFKHEVDEHIRREERLVVERQQEAQSALDRELRHFASLSLDHCDEKKRSNERIRTLQAQLENERTEGERQLAANRDLAAKQRFLRHVLRLPGIGEFPALQEVQDQYSVNEPALESPEDDCMGHQESKRSDVELYSAQARSSGEDAGDDIKIVTEIAGMEDVVDEESVIDLDKDDNEQDDSNKSPHEIGSEQSKVDIDEVTIKSGERTEEHLDETPLHGETTNDEKEENCNLDDYEDEEVVESTRKQTHRLDGIKLEGVAEIEMPYDQAFEVQENDAEPSLVGEDIAASESGAIAERYEARSSGAKCARPGIQREYAVSDSESDVSENVSRYSEHSVPTTSVASSPAADAEAALQEDVVQKRKHVHVQPDLKEVSRCVREQGIDAAVSSLVDTEELDEEQALMYSEAAAEALELIGTEADDNAIARRLRGWDSSSSQPRVRADALARDHERAWKSLDQDREEVLSSLSESIFQSMLEDTLHAFEPNAK